LPYSNTSSTHWLKQIRQAQQTDPAQSLGDVLIRLAKLAESAHAYESQTPLLSQAASSPSWKAQGRALGHVDTTRSRGSDRKESDR